VGEIAEQPGRTPLVDFPRGTGHIAYRKLVLEGGRVKGALLIGERQAKVRRIGRGLKRLIDSGVDVGNEAQRLLDPSFDVSGFLETRKLLAKPEQTRASEVATGPAAQAVPAAKLRGTQVVSLSVALAGLSARAGTALLDSAAMPQAPALGTMALPSSRPASTSVIPSRTSALPGRTSALPASEPRRTRVLSIGLHAEAPLEPLVNDTPIEARFEVQGHLLPITGKLCSIGSAPDSAIRLHDPSVAFLHAQVAQQGRALYLRDAGTQTGTWVNGVPLAGVHALHDGDRILVGRTELTFRSLALAKSSGPSEPVIAVPRLELRSGPCLGLSFVLSTELCSIGSGPNVELQVFEPSVAPQHARVRLAQALHYLSDLGSPSGTYLRGSRLPPGQEVLLGDGELFQVGAIAIAYTRAPTTDRLAAFRPMARLTVMSGAGTGQTVAFAERALVGAAPSSELRLPGTGAHELEIVRHQAVFFARDLSGGRTFKSGSPLGTEWAPLRGGEMLLVSSGALLRFEEP
jgi:pSer/pThr/pTyr-binding forkhead associated (FHA) protein